MSRYGSRYGLLLALCALSCVRVPENVRSTFADATDTENDYLRVRADAPSPLGFYTEHYGARGGDAGAVEAGAGDGAVLATSRTSPPSPISPPSIDGGGDAGAEGRADVRADGGTP